MPNWVTNVLAVSGDKDQIEALLAQVSAPFVRKTHTFDEDNRNLVWVDVQVETEFSFWNIVRPSDLDDYYADSNWYDWNIKHWGTKWDVDATVERSSDDYVLIRFDTAWSQPEEAIAALSEQYPSLTFSLEYEEEQGWGGETVWNAGVGVVVESWDIPTSHSDRTSKDRDCFCEIFGEKVFDDCPTPEPQPVS